MVLCRRKKIWENRIGKIVVALSGCGSYNTPVVCC